MYVSIKTTGTDFVLLLSEITWIQELQRAQKADRFIYIQGDGCVCNRSFVLN